MRLTIERFVLGSRWSTSITHGAYRWPQSAHAAPRSSLSSSACEPSSDTSARTDVLRWVGASSGQGGEPATHLGGRWIVERHQRGRLEDLQRRATDRAS